VKNIALYKLPAGFGRMIGVASLLMAVFLAGCGGGASQASAGTPAGSYTPSFLVGEGQIGCGFVVQRLELGPRSSDHSIGTVRVVAGSLKTEAL